MNPWFNTIITPKTITLDPKSTDVIHLGCAALRLPAQCHVILRQLLELLRKGQKTEAVRIPLLGALLAYLQATRAPRLAHAPPSLFQTLLQGKRRSAIANT